MEIGGASPSMKTRPAPSSTSAHGCSPDPSFLVVPTNVDQCGTYVAGQPNIYTRQTIDPSRFDFLYSIVGYPIQNLLEQQKLIVRSHCLRSLSDDGPLVVPVMNTLTRL